LLVVHVIGLGNLYPELSRRVGNRWRGELAPAPSWAVWTGNNELRHSSGLDEVAQDRSRELRGSEVDGPHRSET
jgi:hypothetical protein